MTDENKKTCLARGDPLQAKAVKSGACKPTISDKPKTL
jgi:hypothetical protein